MKVLLVYFDTMRYDHAGCYGYEKVTTPNIDKLAETGAVFANSYPTDVPTQPSYTSVLTGKRGITTGVVSHGQPEDTIPVSMATLPGVLAEHGILTCGVSTLYRFRKWFASGFTHYLQPDIKTWLQHVTGAQVNEQVIPWLRAYGGGTKDFFLFLHYWDPHTPYSAESKRYLQEFYTGDPYDPDNRSLDDLRSRVVINEFISGAVPELKMGVTDLDYVVAMYDAEIRYADNCFAEVVATLEALKVLDDTMIIFTSDHGEAIYGEHGVYCDHMDAYEQVSHVPLVIWYPERVAPRRVPALVQNIDLPVTVLETFGVDVPEDFEGRSLWPLLEGKEEEQYEAVFTNQGLWSAQRAMRTTEWSLVKTIDPGMLDQSFNGPGQPATELFDRKNDPGETRNVAAENKDILAELELRYYRWLDERLGAKPDPLRSAATAAETVKRHIKQLMEARRQVGKQDGPTPETRARIDDKPHD